MRGAKSVGGVGSGVGGGIGSVGYGPVARGRGVGSGGVAEGPGARGVGGVGAGGRLPKAWSWRTTVGCAFAGHSPCSVAHRYSRLCVCHRGGRQQQRGGAAGRSGSAAETQQQQSSVSHTVHLDPWRAVATSPPSLPTCEACGQRLWGVGGPLATPQSFRFHPSQDHGGSSVAAGGAYG